MYLRICGKVSSKTIELLKIPTIENTITLFADFSKYEIPINSRCEYIEMDKHKVSLNCELILITQQYGKLMDYVHIGWKTIIVLRFQQEIPMVMQSISEIQNWYDTEDFSYLYFAKYT